MPKQAETQWVKAWLVRDKDRGGKYALFFMFPEERREPSIRTDGKWAGGVNQEMCPRTFEDIFPHRLEPGGGPIEVEVAIRVREPADLHVRQGLRRKDD